MNASSHEHSIKVIMEPTKTDISKLIAQHRPPLGPYEVLYRSLHANPELSLQESATAATVAAHLRRLEGCDVRTGIGGHGVVGILRNGAGKTVLLRADMDALPVQEATGLAYASVRRMVDVADGVEKPVMHACGHDMHVVSLLAAGALLHACRVAWAGTLLLLFQPNEERAAGARAMVTDGLYDAARHAVPRPDVLLGAHVMAARAGAVVTCRGVFNSAADSLAVTLYGRGGHGSRPHTAVDPVVLAASTVMRLQTIVSREVDPRAPAVVTVGALHAGEAENVISDQALLRINTRAFDAGVRDHVLAAVERIVRAECEAARSPRPPRFETTSSFPLLVNDVAVTDAVARAFDAHFNLRGHADNEAGSDGAADAGDASGDGGEDGGRRFSFRDDALPSMGSEDFANLAQVPNEDGSTGTVPLCFWNYGGIDPRVWDEAERKGTIDQDIPGEEMPPLIPLCADLFSLLLRPRLMHLFSHFPPFITPSYVTFGDRRMSQ
jgi:amidohydrolase